MEIKGRDLVEGVPKTLTLTDAEVREALAETVGIIVDAVRVALEKTPPELSADIMDKGIVLTGGGSMLKNLDRRLREETGLPIAIGRGPALLGRARHRRDARRRRPPPEDQPRLTPVAAPTLAERRPEIVLAVLLSLCLVTLSLQVRRPGGRTVGEGWLLTAVSPFVDLVTSVRSGVHEVGTWAMSRRALRVENRALTAEVARLRGELLRLRDAEEDKGRLLELFGAHPSPPPGTIPARLIAVESSGPFHTALLDRGASDGLQLDGVVLATGGLLGRVIALGPRTARVQLLSDKTAAVGVLLTHAARPDARRWRAATEWEACRSSTCRRSSPSSRTTPSSPRARTVSTPAGSRSVASRRSAETRRCSGRSRSPPPPIPTASPLVFVLPPVRKSDVTSGPSVAERR